VIQVWGYEKILSLFVCLSICLFVQFFFFKKLFVYLSFCSKRKKESVMLLIEHDYIATVVFACHWFV
jgi:hypothetical protein